MKRVHIFLNAGLCCWSLALFLWCVYASAWAMLPGALALIAFMLHGFQQRVLTMFGKNKNPAAEPQNTVVVAPAPVAPEKEAPRDEKQSNTVISSDVRFEGNIIASGQVYIYGEVHGNIESSGGLIKIMRNGLVRGNIVCRELIIDGTVNGECTSESIDIYEHGNLNGAMSYASLAIKKGGVFVGKSMTQQSTEKKTNVIDLAPEPTADAPAPVQKSRQKS